MTASDDRPKAVDLFAGAGGMSLGLEQAGFDVVGAVEYDPVHAATHEFNFPEATTICASVADLSPEELCDRIGVAVGDLDLVVGGPPCQGFSMIGKRAVEDARNRLVFDFHRLVVGVEAKYFVMENVPGMKIGEQAGLLAELVQEFRRSGYNCRPVELLTATDFGVPQERTRLFLVGARSDVELPRAPTRRTSPTGLELPQCPRVGDALGDLPEVEEYPELLERDWVVAKFEEPSEYGRAMRRIERELDDYSYERIWAPDVLTSSMRTVHTEKSVRRFEATTEGTVEPISRFLRLDRDGYCNTLRAGTDSKRGAYTSPRPIHPTTPRVITVREAARLHSMPDWFRLHSTKWHGFRQVGNAVAPNVGRAVAQTIAEALGVRPRVPQRRVPLGDPMLLNLTMAEAADYYGVDPGTVGQRDRARKEDDVAGKANRYAEIISAIFERHYKKGATSFEFERAEMESIAERLAISLPKNLGDLIYSFRFRQPLPESITSTAPEGQHWIIEGAGKGKYRFRLTTATRIEPNAALIATKIPDATPEIIAKYAQSDEQALLAKVRYNRLIDIFLSVTAYSLQSHLRTAVAGVGQIEIDELYVAVDARGAHYVVPVQAKGGHDQIGVVQTSQDLTFCDERYPSLVARAVAAQFMAHDVIAMFELVVEDGDVRIRQERHYRLVPAAEITEDDLAGYRL